MSQFLFFKIYLFTLLILHTHASNDTTSDQPSPQTNTIPGAGLSIVFIFGGLLYGGLLKSICNRFSIPFNPLLLISGLILGNYHESLGFIGEAAKLVSELNPNGLLAIFLPPLLFESAFKLEWHMFKKQFEQTLILGIPCVLLASLLIMTSLKLIIGYDDTSYTWLQAFLVGCILCCTDIFSFVSKLREIGTPQKVISLIEGESLFNYFTCFLIFQIINQIIINYENYSLLSLGQLVIQEILGGFLFGLCFGAMAYFGIKRINYDGTLVVTVMVIFCYSIYMVAEFTVLRISGIISIVTYGIFMGIFGKPHLTGESLEYVDSFWSYAVFIAETNIFLIAGVLVGVNVLFLEEIMNQTQILDLIFIFFIVLFSRFISILVFKKQLSDLGYGMQMKEALIISLSGLKGAIGISFAIIVFENDDYGYKMRNLFLYHVTGNSLLNLFINSLATVFAVKHLGLSTITKVQSKFFKQFLQRFLKNIEGKKEQMKEEKYLQNVDWNSIDQGIGLPLYEIIIKEIDEEINKNPLNKGGKFEERGLFKLQQALQEVTHKNNPNDVLVKQFDDENMKFHITVEVRKRFINALRHKYLMYHQDHITSPQAVALLIQSANFDLDTETEELQSWIWIKNQFSSTIKFLSQVRKMSIIGSFARNYLFNYVSYCYDVVSSYIQANQQVRMQFEELESQFNQDIFRMILNESEENQKEAEDFLKNYLQSSFPEIEKEVKTKKASFSILLSFKQIIDRYEETGQLQAGQFTMLTDLVNKKRLALDLHNPTWTTFQVKDILKNDQIFGLLPDKILSVLDENLTYFQTFDANEIIQAHSTIAKYIFLIRRGGCSIQYTNGNSIYKQSLSVGSLFGCECLISSTYESTVTTNTLVVAVGIKKVAVEKIMDYFPTFEELFWKKYLFVFYKMFSNSKNMTFHYSQLDKEEFDEIISGFQFKRLDEGLYDLEENSIFLRGKVEIITEIIERPQKVAPLSILFINEVNRIKVLEKSSILLGEIPPQLIQYSKAMLSIHMNSIKKKSSRPSMEGPNSRKDFLKQV